jgi:hypothetical protein
MEETQNGVRWQALVLRGVKPSGSYTRVSWLMSFILCIKLVSHFKGRTVIMCA